MPRDRRRTSGLHTGHAGVLAFGHMGSLHLAAKLREHTAPLVWAEVVGPQIAAATEIEAVHDGVLRVSTRSAVWANELTFHKAEILRRLNARLGAGPGQPAITDLRFLNHGIAARTTAGTIGRGPTADELDDIELSDAELRLIDDALVGVTDRALRDQMRRARMADVRMRTWRLDNGWTQCSGCGDLTDSATASGPDAPCIRCRIEGR